MSYRLSVRSTAYSHSAGTPVSFAHAANGQASTAGTFGSLFGEGDMRAGLSITAQYLQNLEFAIGYNWFMGNPRKTVKDSPIPSNMVTDRDYANAVSASANTIPPWAIPWPLSMSSRSRIDSRA